MQSRESLNFASSLLVDMMIKEVTKEEVGYGFQCEERGVSQTVGKVKVKGKEAYCHLPGHKMDKGCLNYYSVKACFLNKFFLLAHRIGSSFWLRSLAALCVWEKRRRNLNNYYISGKYC